MRYRRCLPLVLFILVAMMLPLLLPQATAMAASGIVVSESAAPPLPVVPEPLRLDRHSPMALGFSTTVLPQVIAGEARTCVINTVGQLYCWGGYSAVPDDLGAVSQVSAGVEHTCVVTVDGALRCWGDNFFGQATVPDDLGAVSQVSAGAGHTCAVTVGGMLRCWGGNRDGQTTLPDDLGAVTQVSANWNATCAVMLGGALRCWGYHIYGHTDVPDDLGAVRQVSVGSSHTCAVTVDGGVRCWGMVNSNQTSVPDDLGAVRQISAGGWHTCAVTVDGAVRCWGANWDGGQATVPADLGAVSQVSAGGVHTCAVTMNGALRCWGSDEAGQVTIPSDFGGAVSQVSAGSVHHTCAVTVAGALRCWGWNRHGQAMVPDDLGAVSQVSAGGSHTCAVTTDGALRCWGENSYGKATVPADLGAVSQVSVGWTHTCAVRMDGVLRCWGANTDWNGKNIGQATVPADLGAVSQVSAGAYHTCAVRMDGVLRCWGANTDWNGNDSGQATVPDDLGAVRQISAGDAYTCAVTVNGMVRCWGYNDVGQTTVPGNLGAVSHVSAGGHHTCAVRMDGVVRCWGSNTDWRGNDSGQATVPDDLGAVRQVSAGGYHTCAVTTDEGLRCWGWNEYGQTTLPRDPLGEGGSSSGVTLTTSATMVAVGSTVDVDVRGAQPGQHLRLALGHGSVGLLAEPLGTADAQGRFRTTLTSAVPGLVQVRLDDPQHGQPLAPVVMITFTAPGITPTDGPVVITQVSARHPLDGRYLAGVSVPNEIAVSVDWRGTTPRWVVFQLNGVMMTIPATATSVRHTLDMGRDLRDGFNSLEIVAVNAAGQRSAVVSAMPFSWPMPVWMNGLIATRGAAMPFMVGSTRGEMQYEWNFVYPPYAFDLGAPGFGGDAAKMSFKLDFEAGVGIPLSCIAPITVDVAGGPKATFGMFDLKATLKAKGSFTAKPLGLCVWELPQGRSTVELKATTTLWKKPVVVLVGYLEPTIGTTLDHAITSLRLEDYLSATLGEVYLDGKLALTGSTGTRLLATAPYVQLYDLEVGGRLGLEAGYRLENPVAEVKLWAGADGGPTFRRPGPLAWTAEGLTFDRVELRGEVGWSVRSGWFERKDSGTLTWRYPEVGQAALAPLAPELPPFRLIPAATPMVSPLATSSPLRALPSGATLVATRVYTYAETTLAASPRDETALMVWVEADPAKSLGQAHELTFSRWDGTAWTAPAALTNDDRLDGAPQLAWAGDGRAVAVWHRMGAVLAPEAIWDAATANQVEIATASFDPATGQWSALAALTTNAVLDFAPQLAAGRDGTLLAAWRQNSAGVLQGDATNPDTVMTAFYRDGWATPAPALTDIPGLVDYAVGVGDGHATLAFVQTALATGAQTPTLQLFTTSWTGTTWAAPVQRTDDTRGHRMPQVVYDAANEPVLVWLSDGHVRSLHLVSGATSSMPLPEGQSIDRLRVVRDPAGNLLLVFSAQATQRDLFLSVYDATAHLWGQPRPLTANADDEVYLAPTLDSHGDLWVGYAATARDRQEQQVMLPSATTPVTYTVPRDGGTDLIALRHALERNLTLAADGLSVSATHPDPATTVQFMVVVSNTGDLAVHPVEVALYAGDPEDGGTELGRQQLAEPLAAGVTATVRFDYRVPSSGGRQTFFAVVDPANRITEGDETDNQASLPAFGPDLVLLEAVSEPLNGDQGLLQAVVQNRGTTPSGAATLRYTTGTVTRTLVTSDQVPPLAAGTIYTITTLWDSRGLAVGTHTLTATVTLDAEPDGAPDDQTLAVQVERGGDLMLTPATLWVEPLAEGGTQIRALVYNVGAVAMQNVPVSFYHDGTFTEEAELFTVTIAEIPAGGYAMITETTTVPLHQGVYALADPAFTLNDINRSNNLAMVLLAFELAFPVSGQVTLEGVGLADVVITDGTRTATTDRTGAYTLTQVLSGTHVLTPTLAGYTFTPVTRTVTVTEALGGQDFAATRLTFPVTGRVTLDGAGLAGVAITDGTRTVTTTATGAYTLTDVPYGPHVLTPTLAGYTFSPVTRTISVTAALTGQDFLAQAATPVTFPVTGRVTVGGVGLADVVITDGTRTVTTTDTGFYVLMSVPYGTHMLTPTLAGYTFSPATRMITVTEALSDQNFSATLRTFPVTGRVTVDGVGLAEVVVTDGTRSATTDSTGAYTLLNVPYGPHVLTPTRAGYTFDPTTRSVTVTAALAGQDFLAQAATVQRSRVYLPLVRR
ncbi:hypothetical protein A9Q02_19220 [Candidatus Chloroploca asiatica]|uniref:CARDB domain-containing protein n=2 Tax=Candidatus Chloroploca asiatica TaxID=1506545 RepID=A0A2H3KIZ0_9CHLR|nr:hypothetical protein A9Q02_19220 [Candidatus Chloroploca asiatica]